MTPASVIQLLLWKKPLLNRGLRQSHCIILMFSGLAGFIRAVLLLCVLPAGPRVSWRAALRLKYPGWLFVMNSALMEAARRSHPAWALSLPLPLLSHSHSALPHSLSFHMSSPWEVSIRQAQASPKPRKGSRLVFSWLNHGTSTGFVPVLGVVTGHAQVPWEEHKMIHTRFFIAHQLPHPALTIKKKNRCHIQSLEKSGRADKQWHPHSLFFRSKFHEGALWVQLCWPWGERGQKVTHWNHTNTT